MGVSSGGVWFENLSSGGCLVGVSSLSIYPV